MTRYYLVLMQNGANFSELVGGDQVVHLEKKRVFWQRVKKELNIHAKVRVRRKVY